MSPPRFRFCKCPPSDRDPQTDQDTGTRYCGNCEELLPDPEHELLRALTRTVVRLEHRLSNGHGSRLDPLAVTKVDAEEMLGISVDHFERYVQPELRVV